MGISTMPLKFATGIATYYQFLLEETIQSGLMGCYLGGKYGHISMMDKVIDRLERVTIPALENYNKKYGFLAFYNIGAFEAFYKAGKIAVEVYKECR